MGNEIKSIHNVDLPSNTVLVPDTEPRRQDLYRILVFERKFKKNLWTILDPITNEVMGISLQSSPGLLPTPLPLRTI